MVIWLNSWNIWTIILEIYFRAQKKYWMKIIIYNSLATVKSFISLLGKIIKKILHEIDPISGEITLKCKGCLLHCPQNWSLTSPPGDLQLRVPKRERNNANTICTYEVFSKSLFYYAHTKEKCVQKLIVYTQYSRKFVQK